MDLALNNIHKLISYKTQPTNQTFWELERSETLIALLSFLTGLIESMYLWR